MVPSAIPQYVLVCLSEEDELFDEMFDSVERQSQNLPVMPELEEVRLEQFDTADGDFGSCAGITAGHDFGVLCGYSVICNGLASNFFPFSGNLRFCRHSSQRFGTCNARCRN